MRSRWPWYGLAIGLTLVCVGIALSHRQTCQQLTPSACIRLEHADTDAERERGLSGRSSLPAGRGMLFVFPSEDSWGFWMKDMHFAIDIVWADAHGKVVDLEELVTPDTYPHVYYPAKKARYVIELPSGSAQAAGIEVGGQLKLP